ncbi:MAG TPA: hypothetical protein VNN08_17755, partial [Thermoanaerobaculia bacterium]|nr:hypothetical protein [Thermoanaerobaculia bacterium]
MRTRKAKGDVCGARRGFPLHSPIIHHPSSIIHHPSAFILLLSAFILLLSLSAQAAAPGVIVLPFDNFSGDENAGREAADLVEKRIVAMGWRLVPSDSVEPFLEKERIRYLDSLEG